MALESLFVQPAIPKFDAHGEFFAFKGVLGLVKKGIPT